MIKFSELADEDPKEVAESVLEYFRAESVPELAFKRAYSCVRCGACWECCPKGINVYMLQVITRAEMFHQGHSPYEGAVRHRVTLNVGGKIYSANDILLALTTKPEQKFWLNKPDERPGPKDYVVFLGCASPSYRGMMKILKCILDNMEIDYVALGGGNPCCGGSTESSGYLTEANKKRNGLIEAMVVYRPKQIIVFCPTCYFRLTKLWGSEATIPDEIKVVHISHFLTENLDKLKFVKKINKKVAHFDTCKMGRMCGEYKAPNKVLQALPGIDLVDVTDVREYGCCGGGSRYYPAMADAIERRTMDRFQESGADVVVSTCEYCHKNFLRISENYSFELMQLLDLVGEAMGLQIEDKIKKYIKYHDPERVMEEARECIEANLTSLGLTKAEFKCLLEQLMP